MKKLIFFGIFLLSVGLTISSFAQTANQYIEAGNQTYGAKDYAKAVQYYQAAAQMDPNSAAAFQGLGNSQYALGQNNEALASYEKALALNPNNTQLSTFVQSLRARVGTSSVSVPSPGASSPAASSGASNKFEVDIMAGVALGSAPFNDLGFGGGIGGYMPMGGGMAIGGSLGYYTFTTSLLYSLPPIGSVTTSSNWSNIEVLASVKYSFEGTGIKPYLKGGAGLDVFGISNSVTYDLNPPYNTPYYESLLGSGTSVGASSMYPMIQFGAGALFSMGPGMGFFVEGKYNMIIGSGGTTSYIPINLGLALDM